jgi:hypothetical protein
MARLSVVVGSPEAVRKQKVVGRIFARLIWGGSGRNTMFILVMGEISPASPKTERWFIHRVLHRWRRMW